MCILCYKQIDKIRRKILMTQNLVFNSQTPKVYKSNKLNQANFGDFNLTDYQVFLFLVSKIGGVNAVGKYLQPEELVREYILSAEELRNVFKVDKSESYKILQKSCKKLMKTSIILEKIDLNQTWEINVCSRAIYNPGEGNIYVKFTDDIMPYLAQVKEKFLLYNLREIANFSSLFTTRLYELLQEFKETGWMLKSIDQLREAFAVGIKYKTYSNLKLKTFGPACDAINRNYDMDLRFEEIKKGKKIVAIKFLFKKTIVCRIQNDTTKKRKNLYIKPAKIYDATEKNHNNKHTVSEKKLRKKTVVKSRVEKPKISFLSRVFSSLFSKK